VELPGDVSRLIGSRAARPPIAVLAGDELRLHVGGGIVADSDPAAELAETDDRAAGWRAALVRLADSR
jgi:anthranilate/para-aminobenzoate synthase component I